MDARLYLDRAPFLDEVNPVDGVVYPFIFKLDDSFMGGLIKRRIKARLQEVLGFPVKLDHVFARMSPQGVRCPHQAHTDESMGQYSLMVYMNRPGDIPWERGCGTSLLRHTELDLTQGPFTPEQAAAVVRDQNQRGAWTIDHLCEMRADRAFIFDASLLHRAEPVGGFGRAQKDARMVLTTFFSEVK